MPAIGYRRLNIPSCICPSILFFDALPFVIVEERTRTSNVCSQNGKYDCGKLQTLADLLRTLIVDQHRVLLFTQITRMLDILENFLNYHGYKYLRLDGSTSIEQRQVLMERFNNDKKIFVFILSTRSGGIGKQLIYYQFYNS